MDDVDRPLIQVLVLLLYNAVKKVGTIMSISQYEDYISNAHNSTRPTDNSSFLLPTHSEF